MKSKSSAIDRFLLRFDYSKKVFFVIFLCIFTALCLLYLFLSTTSPLLNQIHLQIDGLENQLQFNTLLEEIVKHEQVKHSPSYNARDGTAFHQNESAIDQTLNQEIYDSQSSNENFFQSHKLPEKMSVVIAHIYQAWKELEKESPQLNQETKEIHYIKLLSLFEEATRVNTTVYNLSGNFDIGTAYAIQVIINDIPAIQQLLIKLQEITELMNQATPPESIKIEFRLSQNALQQQNAALLENIRAASDVNSSIADQLIEESFVKSLNNYADETRRLNDQLEHLWQTIQNTQQKVILPDSIFSQPFLATTTLAKETIDLTLHVLDTQKKILEQQQYIGVGIIFIGILMVLILYQTKIIRNPLYDLKNTAEKLAEGDLSVKVPITSGEAAEMAIAFNQMVAFFREVMLKAGEITTHLVNSTSQIFGTAHTLESSLVQQELVINQIANNAKGIARTVQDFALSLQEVNNAATVTGRLADLSRTSLASMEIVMQQMANASNNIVNTLSALQEKVESIHLVIKTMVRIADQINLLSLNTAIRAGKKGGKHLGFTVVANKIRELADLTACATLDIEQVVKSIFTTVQDTGIEVEQFSAQIKKLMEEAAEIREFLKKLIFHVLAQKQSFETVNVGMQGQTVRAAQIQDSISSLTEGARRTTESVRTLYSEIEYLYHSTNNLQEMTQRFKDRSILEKPKQPLPNLPLIEPS